MSAISIKLDFEPVGEYASHPNEAWAEHMGDLAIDLSVARHFGDMKLERRLLERIEQDKALIFAGIDPREKE